jgi:hypothetical protein
MSAVKTLRRVRVIHNAVLGAVPVGAERGDILRTAGEGVSYRNEGLYFWDGTRMIPPWNADGTVPDDYGHVPNCFDPLREGIALWGPETWWAGHGDRVRHNRIFYTDLSPYCEQLNTDTISAGKHMLISRFVDPLQGTIRIVFFSERPYPEMLRIYKRNLQRMSVYCLDAEGLPGYERMKTLVRNPSGWNNQIIFMSDWEIYLH